MRPGTLIQLNHDGRPTGFDPAQPPPRTIAAMLARVLSCAVVGLEGELVDVEVDITRSEMPKTIVVGLPDTAVQESRERVRSAIRNSGLSWAHNSKVVVNLAPANLVQRKEHADSAAARTRDVVRASRPRT